VNARLQLTGYSLSLVTLINPQSDNGKRASFPCCVVTVFTDCLATVVSRSALLPDVIFTGVVRQRRQELFTASWQPACFGSAHFGSLRLYSARHGETLLEGGCLPSVAPSRHNTFCSVLSLFAYVLNFVLMLPLTS
jgi:hypothetical protein